MNYLVSQQPESGGGTPCCPEGGTAYAGVFATRPARSCSE